MAFYNRKWELEAFDRILSSNRPQLIIVYGLRGSGKSELLVHAIAGQNALYYQASEELLQDQLVDLDEELRRIGDPATSALPPLTSIKDLFAAVIMLAKKNPEKPFIFVIDEFPYFVEAANPGTETVVQKWWDQNHKTTPNLKVFLSGSHVAWMLEHTLRNRRAPLHNRRTGQIEVRPLTYQHAAEFYPAWSAQDKVRAYGIWGGLPRYLHQIDPTIGLWENVSRALLDPESYLLAEPDWLRFSDLRSNSLYNSLVRAIARGKTMPSDIARAVGYHSATDIFDPLNHLVNMGIVARVEAMNSHQAHPKRPRYQIAEPFFAFWYRFISRLRSQLQQRQIPFVISQIKQGLDEYIGRYMFEDICREWVWTADEQGYLPTDLHILEVGTWWGGTKEEQDDIDVVAFVQSSDELRDDGVLFGECKWSNAPMDLRDLGGIRHAIEVGGEELNPIAHPWRACFSRSGFHPDLIAEAQNPENRIILVGPEQLYGGAPSK